MIATTKDQSQRLLRCGVSADTADMSWIAPNRLVVGGVGFPTLMCTEYFKHDDSIQQTPAWSLSRLLGLLPKIIKRGDCSDYTLNLSCDGCFWDLGYTYARYCGEDDSLVLFEDKDPKEVCVKTIEWLTANGYKLNEI